VTPILRRDFRPSPIGLSAKVRLVGRLAPPCRWRRGRYSCLRCHWLALSLYPTLAITRETTAPLLSESSKT